MCIDEEASLESIDGEEMHLVRRVFRDLKNVRIKEWLHDEPDGDGGSSEHQRPELVLQGSTGGKSVHFVLGPEKVKSRLAKGKLRKKIDWWRKEQEEVRRAVAAQIMPSPGSEGPELQWFEGFHGL